MTRHPPLGVIVFDCDGILTDTHGLWDQAYAALFARYEAGITPASRRRLATLGTQALGQALAGLLNHAEPPGVLAAEIVSLVASNLGRPVIPIPGATEIVTALAATRTLAVASNSPSQVVRSHLTQIGIADMFRAIVGIDDAAAPKPAPDLYQLACARLGITPQHCTAIEDSREGISSATAAGLYVIGIQAPGDSLDADAVYPGLSDTRLWRALGIPGSIGNDGDAGSCETPRTHKVHRTPARGDTKPQLTATGKSLDRSSAHQAE